MSAEKREPTTDEQRLYRATPRGIGSSFGPCMACGGDDAELRNDCAFFVPSRETGEAIVALFEHGARLDYRPHEPHWCQVKITACHEHKPWLESLVAAVRETDERRDGPGISVEMVAAFTGHIVDRAAQAEVLLADVTADVFLLSEAARDRSLYAHRVAVYVHERICNVRLALNGEPTRDLPPRPTFEGPAVSTAQLEREALERAIDRMGWPEIHAYQDELRKGQDVYEDAGGFFMRAIRRLFGLPSPHSEVTTYQQAARAMVAKAEAGQ